MQKNRKFAESQAQLKEQKIAKLQNALEVQKQEAENLRAQVSLSYQQEQNLLIESKRKSDVQKLSRFMLSQDMRIQKKEKSLQDET